MMNKVPALGFKTVERIYFGTKKLNNSLYRRNKEKKNKPISNYSQILLTTKKEY